MVIDTLSSASACIFLFLAPTLELRVLPCPLGSVVDGYLPSSLFLRFVEISSDVFKESSAACLSISLSVKFSEDFNVCCHGWLCSGALAQACGGGQDRGHLGGGGGGAFIFRAGFFLIFEFSGLHAGGSEAWRLAVYGRPVLGGDGSRLPGGHGGRGGVEGRLLPLRPRVRGCSLLGNRGGQGDGDRGLPDVRGCSIFGGGGVLRLAGDL